MITPLRPRPCTLIRLINVPLPTNASTIMSFSRSKSWLFVAFAAALKMTFLTTSAYFFGLKAHCATASSTRNPRTKRHTSLNFLGLPLASRRMAWTLVLLPSVNVPANEACVPLWEDAGDRCGGDETAFAVFWASPDVLFESDPNDPASLLPRLALAARPRVNTPLLVFVFVFSKANELCGTIAVYARANPRPPVHNAGNACAVLTLTPRADTFEERLSLARRASALCPASHRITARTLTPRAPTRP